jgi:hypothetical protein
MTEGAASEEAVTAKKELFSWEGLFYLFIMSMTTYDGWVLLWIPIFLMLVGGFQMYVIWYALVFLVEPRLNKTA